MNVTENLRSLFIQILERSCVMRRESRTEHNTKKNLSFSAQKQMV